ADMLDGSGFANAYDILFNIEKPAAVSSIEINGLNGFLQFNEKEEVEAFIKDYQTAAHQMPESATMRDVRNASLAWTNVRFPETNYYGDASIYNEALQERIMDTNSLAEFLGISDVEEMYTVSLSAEEKDRKSTRLNSSHVSISYAVFC